jgi:hypothetical protein
LSCLERKICPLPVPPLNRHTPGFIEFTFDRHQV